MPRSFSTARYVAEVVAHGVEIVHAAGDRHDLLPLLFLHLLLHSGMEIANLGRDLDDRLAIQYQLETKNPMRRRVLWSHRNSHVRIGQSIRTAGCRYRGGWNRGSLWFP